MFVELETREMWKLMLGCCTVYISETRNWTALESIEKATKIYQWVAIVNKFEDEAYNQVGYKFLRTKQLGLQSWWQLTSAPVLKFPPGTFSSSTEGQGGVLELQDALVAAYLVMQDEESNVFSMPETWSWLFLYENL